MYTNYDNYLQHHGIKGMKWGVRRFQNEDGSYTSSGKKRYGIGEKIKNSISDQYQQTFKISKKDADKEAEKTKELLKKVAIGTGVAVGIAAGAYIASRIGRGYVDDVIKAGKTLQTVHMNPDRINTGQAFYAAHRNMDKIKYLGFGKEMNILGVPVIGSNNKNVISTKLNSTVKIAGSKNGKKVFDNLLKNNSEFRDLFNNNITAHNVANYPELKLSPKANNWTKFNVIDLLDNDPSHASQQRLQKIFYDELKKKGYSGVRDINDAIRSGYNTKATIFFDKSKIGETTVREVTNKEILKGYAFILGGVQADQMIPQAVALSPIAGIAAVNSRRDSQLEKKYDRKPYDW